MTSPLRREQQVTAELALNTWDSVYAPDGEIVAANRVIAAGIDELADMSRYRAYDTEAYAMLEGAVRHLRILTSQREQTAEEFLDTALAEVKI